MARSAASFNRPKPSLKQVPTVLILCEDSKSCLQYLRDAAAAYRATPKIRVLHAGRTDPLGIVAAAVIEKGKYDEVFCAIDRDTHHGFDEAVAEANKHGVELIVSYPAYEYWLLLHFRYSRAGYVRQGNKSPGDCVVADLRACEGMQNYDKGTSASLFQRLEGRLGAASDHAVRALADALAVDEMNPSTRIHVLLGRIRNLGAPQPIG